MAENTSEKYEENWRYIRSKIDERIDMDTLLRGLGKLSIASCISAGMDNGEAESVATLFDILVAAAEQLETAEIKEAASKGLWVRLPAGD